MSFPSDRDSRLNNFNKTFGTDLDDTNKRLRNNVKQILSRDFEDELRQAEFSAKRGDMLDAYIHKLPAEYFNSLLKDYD